jgi:uncharacterized phage protein (TIGR02218 family)
MRVASPQLEARLALGVTTLARLWRVQRADGTVLRFTDAVRPIQATVGADVGLQTYRSDISFTCSAILTSRSFANAQSVSVTFILDDAGFSEKDIRLRKYDFATSEVYIVDYTFPEYGAITVFAGSFGQMKLTDQHAAEVQVIPSSSGINGKSIGNARFSQTCRNSLGDGLCTVDIEALKVAFTVGSASAGSFVAAALTQESGHWGLGFVKWVTGNNAGTTSKVQSNDSGSTSVFLIAPPSLPILAGDTGFIYPGCDKLRRTCLDKFNNVNNGQFEPDVPDGSHNIATGSSTRLPGVG